MEGEGRSVESVDRKSRREESTKEEERPKRSWDRAAGALAFFIQAMRIRRLRALLLEALLRSLGGVRASGLTP